ncbi:helix-turn-helix domain-containing protein [Autumnicola edwardsiae]|uniref:Helix-turn-helix domain-containing protein n=1 Tax=Autumnicola edwardsiae TaxID=3075594 RepID=A0ABU3CTR5_9FLAO|nr:helix-turn-helix domain-containing protein [Zunongwangia sp. F297]MDT0649754.1 helix-turn-helix domain-containing protein [Zunongwangia sp. F297]
MQQVQIIQDPENFTQDLVDQLKTSLLTALQKEFQPKEPEEYLSRAEVAKMLKIDLSTLFKWTKAGKLKKHALGNRVYYKRSEVEQAIVEL